MAAYLIVRVEITDHERYDRYKQLTPAAVAAYGGRFVVRGGPSQVLEGPPEDRRLVVLEFPSADDARAFYASPEYGEARDVRAGAADMQMILVEGA